MGKLFCEFCEKTVGRFKDDGQGKFVHVNLLTCIHNLKKERDEWKNMAEKKLAENGYVYDEFTGTWKKSF